jgi:hypothetical protein
VYCASTRHILDGSIDHNSVCIYGYQLTLDPTKTVQSLTLPNDRDVVLLSADLLPAAVQGTFTYSPSAGAVLQPGSNTLSTVFTPADPQTYSSAQASVSLLVNGPSTPITPTIAWPTPAPIVYGTPLTSVQLNASAVATDPATIPLGPVSRVDAFYPDGTLFLERGFDGTYTAFSATQLGTSLSYAGYSFPLGIPDRRGRNPGGDVAAVRHHL